MRKKAELSFVWSKLINIALVLALLIILILAVYFLNDNSKDIWKSISNILRFT
ncbi:MAG: hypothetical protein MAG795_01005 [Candidatus Woesearchaeota archaeon]|nr:hypothetical protein [Candidatus Woesearchaeota archaeon]